MRVGQARPFILQLDASNNETCNFNGKYVDDSETNVKVVLCPKVVSLCSILIKWSSNINSTVC